MNMGEKIKVLRSEKGLTLEELGNKVGVGKSTVRKWENGIIANMRRDKIAKVAEALGTSPGYLMGWDDEKIIDSFSTENIELSVQVIGNPDLKRLITYYNNLNDIGQKKVMDLVEDMSKIYCKNDEDH